MLTCNATGKMNGFGKYLHADGGLYEVCLVKPVVQPVFVCVCVFVCECVCVEHTHTHAHTHEGRW